MIRNCLRELQCAAHMPLTASTDRCSLERQEGCWGVGSSVSISVCNQPAIAAASIDDWQHSPTARKYCRQSCPVWQSSKSPCSTGASMSVSLEIGTYPGDTSLACCRRGQQGRLGACMQSSRGRRVGHQEHGGKRRALYLRSRGSTEGCARPWSPSSVCVAEGNTTCSAIDRGGIPRASRLLI